MPRYAAFLRGVMPTNAKMPDLRKAFEDAGFGEVTTVLASGNVVFSARAAPLATLQRKAEAAMEARLGRTFLTIVRPLDALQDLLVADPFRAYRLRPDAKRIVTFLLKPPPGKVALPFEQDGLRLLSLRNGDVLGAYVRSPKGPVFMTHIEKLFGREQTTRTWDTVAKVAR